MKVSTKDIIKILDVIAPFRLAEEWDNSGLQVGNPESEVRKIMLSLDVTMPLMVEAEKTNCELVITHHPLMITPSNSFDFTSMPGSIIQFAALHGINIVSAHTNLDKSVDGLNDYFASKIGLENLKPFLQDASVCENDEPVGGIGRTGIFNKHTTLSELARQIKNRLGIGHIRVTGDMELPLKTAAVCTGSGGSLIHDFLKTSADVFITGDMKYHDARTIEENSKALIDVGHFASEQIVVDLLHEKLSLALKKAGHNIQIIKFLKEKDPFTIV